MPPPPLRTLALAAGGAAAALLLVQWARRAAEQRGKRGTVKIPTAPASLWENMAAFMQRRAPFHLYSQMLLVGTCFRLRMPKFTPIFVLVDQDECKKLLEGDKKAGFRELDKNKGVMKEINKAFRGRNTLFSKLTFDSSGVSWESSRKHLSKAFSMHNLHQKMPILEVTMQTFIAHLEWMHEAGEDADASLWCNRFTMDFLCAAMFDLEAGAIEGSADGFSEEKSIGRMLADNFELSALDLAQRIWNPLKKYMFWDRDGPKARDEIWEASAAILRDYRETHTPEEIEADTGILGQLVKGPYESEDERIADTLVQLFAGHDTTGHTLAWVLIELARHPHTMGELQEALDEENPSGRRTWTPEMLSRVTYLDNIVTETLRLWPAAPVAVVRHADREVRLGNGMVIPKGSDVMMPAYLQHRANIRNPEEWLPERWLGDQLDELRKNQRPYGAGKRVCVGKNLANLELRYATACLAQHFNISLASEPTAEHYITLKPKNGMLRLVPREDFAMEQPRTPVWESGPYSSSFDGPKAKNAFLLQFPDTNSPASTRGNSPIRTGSAGRKASGSGKVLVGQRSMDSAASSSGEFARDKLFR